MALPQMTQRYGGMTSLLVIASSLLVLVGICIYVIAELTAPVVELLAVALG